MGKAEDVFKLRVKALAKKRGKTLKEIAEAIGVNQHTLYGCVGRHARPSMETLRGLAKELNVSVDYLLGRDLDGKRVNRDEVHMIQRAYKHASDDSKEYIVGMVKIMLNKIANEKLKEK